MSENLISERRSNKSKIAGVIVSTGLLAGCVVQPEVLADIDQTDREALKASVAQHVAELLVPYDKAEITIREQELLASSARTHRFTENNRKFIFHSSDSVRFQIGSSALGTTMTVERNSSEYCMDKKTNTLVDEVDCTFTVDRKIDRGYRVAFINPEEHYSFPAPKLTPQNAQRFITDDGTYLSSIGDAFEISTLYINESGHVTKDGYFDNIATEQEIISTLQDLVD